MYLHELRGGGFYKYNPKPNGKPKLKGISPDLCMTVFMSYQRNVNMTTCVGLKDSSGPKVAQHQQEFEFNPVTQEIVAIGLCLNYNPSNKNVFLHECTGGGNQVGRRE